jgi:hypothetical protein
MTATQTLSISNLLSLLFLNSVEERRLRAILACSPIFRVKMQTQFDLQVLARKGTALSKELDQLEAGK